MCTVVKYHIIQHHNKPKLQISTASLSLNMLKLYFAPWLFFFLIVLSIFCWNKLLYVHYVALLSRAVYSVFIQLHKHSYRDCKVQCLALDSMVCTAPDGCHTYVTFQETDIRFLLAKCSFWSGGYYTIWWHQNIYYRPVCQVWLPTSWPCSCNFRWKNI